MSCCTRRGVMSFLSTPSARRATGVPSFLPLGRNISIHALREEGDCRRSPSGRCCGYFYPRPPRGGRRIRLPSAYPPLHISIHALREEGDGDDMRVLSLFDDFYPRPPRGGRLADLQG